MVNLNECIVDGSLHIGISIFDEANVRIEQTLCQNNCHVGLLIKGRSNVTVSESKIFTSIFSSISNLVFKMMLVPWGEVTNRLYM